MNKTENMEQPRGQDQERGASNRKKCTPKAAFGISTCCCLLGCLLPGIGLLAYTYLTYGNYESVQATVVGQTFCGYYRRRSLKGVSSLPTMEIPNMLDEDEGELELHRFLKKYGSSSSSSKTSSSTNKKENHYKMTYEFLTLEGENITTTTDYCVKARRNIGSTEYMMYDPDSPYTIVHETKPTGYIAIGGAMAAAGAVLLCAGCIIYKMFMKTFGDMMGSGDTSNNPNGMMAPGAGTTEHSESNHGGGGGMPATTGLAAAFSQFSNPNAANPNSNTNPNGNNTTNVNQNTAAKPTGMAGLASAFSQFTNPNANTNNTTNGNTNGSNQNAGKPTGMAGLASAFSQFTNPNGNTNNNAAPNSAGAAPTQTSPPNYSNNSNAYGSTTNTDNAYGNSGTAYSDNNNSSSSNNNNYSTNTYGGDSNFSTAPPPSAPPPPSGRVGMTGYQPP
ncbi:MAG: hypothetical protein SGBAC_008054 [Bacillariaceae sp.]